MMTVPIDLKIESADFYREAELVKDRIAHDRRAALAVRLYLADHLPVADLKSRGDALVLEMAPGLLHAAGLR